MANTGAISLVLFLLNIEPLKPYSQITAQIFVTCNMNLVMTLVSCPANYFATSHLSTKSHWWFSEIHDRWCNHPL